MKDMHVDFNELSGIIDSMDPANNDKYFEPNDITLGRLYADLFREVVRYCPDRREWLVFNGKVWIWDTDAVRVEKLSQKACGALMAYAAGLVGKQYKEYTRFILSSHARNKRINMLKDARSYMSVYENELDRNINLFNCQNGTFDFSNYTLRAHNSTDMITAISNVIYDPAAESELLRRFISDIMQDDPERIAYLQKCIGYSITGHTNLECFFITYGKSTRNGKGTLDTLVRYALGGYAGAAAPETFSSSKYKSSEDKPNPALVSIRNKHFVSVSEPEEQMQLNAAFVKQLTGNDVIRARGLYQSGIEFVPQFKLWMNTNYLPAVSDETVFSSNRVIVIPFERHFSEEERDTSLKHKLKDPEVVSAFFNWCLDGYEQVKREGLVMPDFIRNAVDQYAISQNRIREFLNECLINDEDGKIRFSALYKTYREYCRQGNYKEYSRSRFKSKVMDCLNIRSYNNQDYVFGKAFAKDCVFLT